MAEWHSPAAKRRGGEMNVHKHKKNPVYTSTGDKDFKYLRYAIFTLWALFMMDVITTGVILSAGGYEMNAIMRPFAASPALHTTLKMAVLGLIAAVAYFSDKLTNSYGTVTVTVISAWYILVVSHNIIQMIPAVL